MADQFENIRSSSVDISQVTFAELISVKKRTARTFVNKNVADSLRNLAFRPNTHRKINSTREPYEWSPTGDAPQIVKRAYSLKTNKKPTSDIFKKYVCNQIDADYTATFAPEEPLNSDSLTGMRLLLRWAGVPRVPVNIFNAFIKVVRREVSDGRQKSTYYVLTNGEGHLDIVGPEACTVGSTIDYWKQNSNGGILQDKITSTNLNVSTIDQISTQDINSITSRDNWLWSIPGNPNSIYQDFLAIRFDDGQFAAVVESLEVYLLINQIEIEPEVLNYCQTSFPVNDPATQLEVAIEYTNNYGKKRSFSDFLQISDIYKQISSENDDGAWDTQSLKGNGIKGEYARWETFKFVLDNTAGTGLDQYTEATTEVIIGEGDIGLEDFTMTGLAEQFEACPTNVIINKQIAGIRIDDTKSIALPNSQGGTWTISLLISQLSNSTYTTAALPHNASAITVQTAISSLDIVGLANVIVSGTGTYADPFIVTFTNDLAGVSVDTLTADGSNLEDVAEYVVTTLRPGRYNERQVIETIYQSYLPFKVKFDGQTTIDIAYNASINTRQSAIEALVNIGVGNILVTGSTTDRDAPYTGPTIIDFVGTFIGENLPTLEVVSVEPVAPYKVTTISQGNEAVWTQQKVSILAEGGTFTLTISNPYNPTESYTTTQIDYNASATDVKLAIQAAPWSTWGYDFMTATVQKVVNYSGTRVSTREWIVDFTMEWPTGNIDPAGIDVPTMDVDGSNLSGGVIEVDTIAEGVNTADVQTVTLINGNSGSYTLRATLDSISVASEYIEWDASEVEFKSAMLRHPSLSEENITVTKLTTTETYETGKYEVRIEGFGDIPLLVPYYEDTLLCVPIGVGNAVINPPYTYSIPDSCDLPETSCQTGNILSRPCEGEGASDTVICCNQDTIAEDKNISSYLEYERDLFDPNRILTKDGQDRFITVGDLLAMKNLNRSEYVIYKQSNDKLVSVGFNETLLPGTRIVAVENTLNSDESINRIKNYINSKITVLPSRQV